MPWDASLTYPPLNTLKPVAKNVWIVDGPSVRFGLALLKFPFSTRMTIIRVGGQLFVHSPTTLTEPLRMQVDAIGAPAWIVGPNRIHYSWLAEWASAYPDATLYLAPRIQEQAGKRFVLELATLPIAGGYMTEVEFFHYATRTLILTDLIENFEPQKLGSLALRFLARAGGVSDPHGGMPRDLRLTFVKHRAPLRAAVQKMLSWKPERIILAHGRWYEKHGEAELRRAFSWVGAL
jgi:hypothetical protein